VSTLFSNPNPDRLENKDFYPTPNYVTRALMKREKFEGMIWECASGEGHMAKILECYHDPIRATDIRMDNSIYGRKGVNFLLSNVKVSNIVTNPPFCSALDFVKHAKRCAEKKIAFFLCLQFLEGQERYRFFQDKKFPLKVVYVFSRRITFHLKELSTLGGGKVAFAWFVWDRAHVGSPTIEWISPRHEVTND